MSYNGLAQRAAFLRIGLERRSRPLQLANPADEAVGGDDFAVRRIQDRARSFLGAIILSYS